MKYNDWSIEEVMGSRVVTINGEPYPMSDKEAGIAHAILLLVDAVKELTSEVSIK